MRDSYDVIILDDEDQNDKYQNSGYQVKVVDGQKSKSTIMSGSSNQSKTGSGSTSSSSSLSSSSSSGVNIIK